MQKRPRLQQCTPAAKQEATSSAEDPIQDSRADARRRRREDRQSVEPLNYNDSPVEIDPVSELTSLFIRTCLLGLPGVQQGSAMA